MRALSLVSTDGAGEPLGACSMEYALIGLAKRVAARRPVVAMLVWEEPDGTLMMETLPDSAVVKRGLADTAFRSLFPQPLP